MRNTVHTFSVSILRQPAKHLDLELRHDMPPMGIIEALIGHEGTPEEEAAETMHRCEEAFKTRARKQKSGTDDADTDDDLQGQVDEEAMPAPPPLLDALAHAEAEFLKGQLPAGAALGEEETDEGVTKAADAYDARAADKTPVQKPLRRSHFLHHHHRKRLPVWMQPCHYCEEAWGLHIRTEAQARMSCMDFLQSAVAAKVVPA